MILALIPDVIKLPVAMALGAALMFYPATWTGASGERHAIATEALKTSVTVLRERNAINEEITASDTGALCAALGLSDDETTECMRRVAAPDADARNGSQDHDGRPAVCQPGSKP